MSKPPQGGQAMKRLRAQRGRMSQEMLAEQVRAAGYRLSTSAITRIETGVDRPKYSTAAAIDDALEAKGEVLAAFGYRSDEGDMPTRLAAVERLGRAQAQVVQQIARVVIERLGDDDELVARLDALERLAAQRTTPADS